LPKSGYLFDGLTANKYGDRSDAIGKRFGRLKTKMGFGPESVFHSIRKTVANMLGTAGIPESTAADILGHDRPSMTYGLYSVRHK
jgi:integrase